MKRGCHINESDKLLILKALGNQNAVNQEQNCQNERQVLHSWVWVVEHLAKIQPNPKTRIDAWECDSLRVKELEVLRADINIYELSFGTFADCDCEQPDEDYLNQQAQLNGICWFHIILQFDWLRGLLYPSLSNNIVTEVLKRWVICIY